MIERELRGAARQARTWWRRVVTMTVALLVFGFTYLTLSQWSMPSAMGGELFGVLSVFGMIYALLSGPLATVDSLARERREGTLGLLFLTELTSPEVVLGKTAAASLDMALGLAVVLPLAALPLLLGGVNLTQYAQVVLVLADIMFLSLAIGVWASAMLQSSRAALGVTLATLVILTIGLPLFGVEVLRVNFGSRAASFLYCACPLYALRNCLENPGRIPRTAYWMSIVGMQALAWICLGIACLLTRNAWRDTPRAAGRRSKRTRNEPGRSRGSSPPRARRFLPRSVNPVEWLESRDRWQPLILRTLILVLIGFCMIKHGLSHGTWPDDGWQVLLPLMAHYSFCVWLAIAAPRRLSDDRQSGALELLLCTPIRPGEIVRGIHRSQVDLFGRAFLALSLLYAYLIFAYCNENKGFATFLENDSFLTSLAGLAVLPLQAYALARVGIYQGLAQTTSVRATFMLLWKLCLSPWVLFLGTLLIFDYAHRFNRNFPDITEEIGYSLWVVAHWIPCLFYLVQAEWRLNRRFRALAALGPPAGLWRRALNRFRRRQYRMRNAALPRNAATQA